MWRDRATQPIKPRFYHLEAATAFVAQHREEFVVSLAEQYEKLWKKDNTPDPFAFLAQNSKATLREQMDVLLLDQQLCHTNGSSRAIEEYFERLPEILSQPENRVDLLTAEFRQLSDRGLALNRKEFAERHPQVAAVLLKQLPDSNVDRHGDTAMSQTDDLPPESQDQTKTRPPQDHQNGDQNPHRSRTIDSPQRASAPPAKYGVTVNMPEKIDNEAVTTPDLPRDMRIGRYRILSVLGEGGFGKVYRARDERLERDIAIKVPHHHRINSTEASQEYLVEAKIIASLSHPNIVPIYDFGQTPEGLCYIVSKRIEGVTLTQYVSDMKSSHIEIAKIIAHVAEALHYAHNKELVHRDVKPGNILVDAAGIPVVIDFGLALRDEDFGTGNTFLGTPSYMSPEQARGEGHLADRRSDIFSLGTVLYMLLTGTKPFKGKDVDETIEYVMRRDPPSLRVIDKTIPRELERICLRALEKRAVDRYMTALDFAEELKIFLQDAASASVSAAAPAIQALEKSVSASSRVGTKVVSVVPKGLRPFDGADADFFLALLPGAKDRDGLPNSVRFWKTLIAERDRDRTFRVGLIYGPSGCGKSSLVQAGLLPRLPVDIVPVYIEATAAETETRILNGIRKRSTALGDERDVASVLSLVRRGKVVPTGQKVVLILDQFEQWLHAHAEDENPILVRALRQCDGENLQCILMVRDDFWMAANRLMQSLEVNQIEGRNMAVVDLFDKQHARKVLIALGRAFERLPGPHEELSREQNRFVNAAVNGLAEDGKVVSVRIALFAEMIKGRDWKPATLTKLGGIEGVGVRFLEETFSAESTPPQHQLHEKAVRRVLQTLLPEEGTDIKGHMRSNSELLKVSGYEHRPKDFRDLLHLLDTQLRLVTPTDPVGTATNEDSVNELPSDEKWYQLTHDYLVQPLREWLKDRQKESAAGRAELKLRDGTRFWNAKRENRRLPSFREWLTIFTLTQQRNWSEPQQEMMRTAGRHHMLRTVGSICVVATLGLLGLQLHGATHADGLVEKLLAANKDQLLPTIDGMTPYYRRWTDNQLRDKLANSPDESEESFRIRLALLPADESQHQHLQNRLLTADLESAIVIRDSLKEHTQNNTDVASWLWKQLANEEHPPTARLNAAIVLAGCAPPLSKDDKRWRPFGDFLVDQIVETVSKRPDRYTNIHDSLRPARAVLFSRLHTYFTEDIPDRTRKNAATQTVIDFAREDPAALAALAELADTQQFLELFSHIESHSTEVAAYLEKGLADNPEENSSPEELRNLNSRKGNAALTLMRLGRSEVIWPLFRHCPDSSVRSTLISQLERRKVDIQLLLERFDRESDKSAKRGLMLALGDYRFEQIPVDQQSPIERQIARLLLNDPDAGIHASALWLLKTWGRDAILHTARDSLKEKSQDSSRNWYVTQGEKTKNEFTMVTLDGRDDVSVGRIFEIATTEVSLRQYYDSDTNDNHYNNDTCHPDMECPVTVINWFEAVKYCQWLSERERISPEEYCYRPLEELTELVNDKPPNLLTLLQPDLTKTGYRLPTTEEWLLASKAGASTQWAFGDDDSLLPHYGWCAANSKQRSWPGGMRKPNDFGIFDLYGNVREWMAIYSDGSDGRVETQGNTFTEKLYAKGVKRGNEVPSQATDGIGMRVARTSAIAPD